MRKIDGGSIKRVRIPGLKGLNFGLGSINLTFFFPPPLLSTWAKTIHDATEALMGPHPNIQDNITVTHQFFCDDPENFPLEIPDDQYKKLESVRS